MSTFIKPTIGRKLWYWPTDRDMWDGMLQYDAGDEQALDATIIYVWHDRSVSLRVIDHNGVPFVRTHIPLANPDDKSLQGTGFASWMPYQMGQAAKQDDSIKAPAKPEADPETDWTNWYSGLAGEEFRRVTFTILPNGRTTVCQITLDNGFTVCGLSECILQSDFDAGLGQELAFDDAERNAREFRVFRAMEWRRKDRSGDKKAEGAALPF